MLEWLLSLPRYAKRFISVMADLVFLSGSMLVALFATQADPVSSLGQTLPIFLLSVPATIIAFTKLGLYRAVVRYIGQHALGAVLAGIISMH
jgi:FlaA1/EpsC-like NDP-sugar epimerase